MIARHYGDVESMDVEMEGARGVSKRVLAGPEENAPNFVMRLFALAPGGRTPNHTHDWEHEVFVVEGEGYAESNEGNRELAPGTAVYVAPGETHGFVNTGESVMRFICVVPRMD
jgi:quercetin dioxygenase-like cupin family protein